MENELVTFLPVSDAQADAILAAMRAVAGAGGVLRDADEATLAGAAVHIFERPGAVPSSIPPPAAELAAILPGRDLRRYACELIAVMAFVDGSIDRPKIEAALAYARALEVSDDYLIDLREAALGHIEWVVADMSRKNTASIAGMDVDVAFSKQFLPYDAAPDPALTARFSRPWRAPADNLRARFFRPV